MSAIGVKICDYYCEKMEQGKCLYYPFNSPGLYDCCPHKMGPGYSGFSGDTKALEDRPSTRRQFKNNKNKYKN